METFQLGEIAVTRKDVKNVHLTVHPPEGRVTLVAPSNTRLEVVRAFAITKLSWIRDQRATLHAQARETPRAYVERESHHLWGRRYLLHIIEKNDKPSVRLGHRKITLTVRPGSSARKREEVLYAWHKTLLHEAVPPLIGKWEAKLRVRVEDYFLQRMKTKWGSCNARAGNIRLNTELVKKPKELLDYVIAHEVMHLVEPKHSDRFIALMSKHVPGWREARAE